MKKIIISLVVICVVYACFNIFSKEGYIDDKVYAMTSENQDDEIIKAARDNLERFLSMIPLGYENLYGFSSREDFLKADVGIPYSVYTLSTEFLKNENSDLKKYLYQVDEWRVPVWVGDKMCCLLTVVKKDNHYKCVDLGGAALANELNGYEKYFSAGFQKKSILRLYQINCDFLVIMEKNSSISNGNYYALSSSAASLDKYKVTRERVYNFNELSPLIKMKYSEQFDNKK
jgi:hypothetical protein